MNAAIAIESLSFGYNNTPVLNELSLTIEQGKLTCLLGSNGAGKTTLINLILGRLACQPDTIALFGNKGTKKQSLSQVKHRIGSIDY